MTCWRLTPSKPVTRAMFTRGMQSFNGRYDCVCKCMHEHCVRLRFRAHMMACTCKLCISRHNAGSSVRVRARYVATEVRSDAQ